MKIIGFTGDRKDSNTRLLVDMAASELARIKGDEYMSSEEIGRLYAGQTFEVSGMFAEAKETIEAWKGLQQSIKKTRDDSAKLLAKMETEKPKAVA